jgi:hypothetical protein
MSNAAAPSRYRLRLPSILLLLAAGVAPPLQAQELRASTFAFGKGTPFLGVTTLGDIDVQLLTTNTEPWGQTGFRDRMAGVPAEILLCFSRPIEEFRISFSRVMAGEILRSFSAGPPTKVEGDLIDLGELRFSVPPSVGDGGKGSLIWQGVKARSFSFVIDNKPGWATAVDSFALSAPPADENSAAAAPSETALRSGVCDRPPIGF